MKRIRPSLLFASLLLPLAVTSQAQAQRREQTVEGNCRIERVIQRDGSYSQERRCVQEAPGYAMRGDEFDRMERRLNNQLMRNQRLYDNGRITAREYRRTERRLRNELARNDERRDAVSGFVGGTAAYAPRGEAMHRYGERETYWDRGCRVERTWLNNGQYSEKRMCP